MNIGDGSDYVGAWTFLLPKVAPSQPSTEWRRIADMTRAALSHLLDQALLQFPLAVTSETRAERELQITTDLIAVPEELAPWVEVLRGRQQLGALEISGKSIVESPRGDRALDGVLGVSIAVMPYGSSIGVWTLSDVWLPYDLNGRPQPIVSSFNAPRLESALEEIERAVGVAAVGEDTRFADRDGYTLRNRRVHGNVYGEVLDLQDMGYDESWIVGRWPEPE